MIRAGVLRFIDQNMIDPTVQPIQDPSRDRGIGQQRLGLANQIVKIQQTAVGLSGVIDRQKDIGKTVQGDSLFESLQHNPPAAGKFDT